MGLSAAGASRHDPSNQGMEFGAPLDQIRAGTPPYLEPFLQLKERGQRWDTAAERFAAAMVLHEMATGALPYWGDRQSAPYLVNAEAPETGRGTAGAAEKQRKCPLPRIG